MAVGFRVLGPVAAWIDDRPVELGHARQRFVLAVLLIEANQWLSVDRLLDHAWGERIPPGGRDTLYGYLSRLRRTLRATGEADIVHRPGGYELVVDEDAVDVHRFHRLVADANAGNHDAGALFEEALGLWRGEVCAGMDTPWAQAVRAELDRQRLTAELDYTDLRLRLGRHTDLLADLTSLAAAHPLDERLAGQFMLALYRSGRQADALGHYQQLRTRLDDELGTEPGPDLRQLHQQILAADTILAAPAAGADRSPAIPRQLPAAPRLFTGRVPELAELDHALTSDLPDDTGGTVVISAIGGVGGIGKTWLALAWAHHNLHRFPDGQLFVDLRGFSPTGRPTEPGDAVRGFLVALGVDPAALPSDLDALAALYRSLVAGRRMLVMLDNAATTDQVVPLLPGTPACTVLVTGRTTLSSLIDRYGARHLPLDVLTRAEAHGLLAKRLGHQRIDAEPDVSGKLIELCGRHPLALAITARHATTRPQVPLAEFATELSDLGLDMLDGDDPTGSLPTVLSWSLHHLTGEQRTVFALLGIAPGPDIDLAAAASLAGLPTIEARKALRALENHSLLDRHPGNRYAMHDLIRAYAARGGLSEPVREAALARVVDFYLHTAYTADRLINPHRDPIQLDPPTSGTRPQPLPDPAAAVDWLDTHHSHLLAAQQTAAARHRHHTVWQIAWSLGTFHRRRGHRHDDLAVWRAAADAADHLPDPTVRVFAQRLFGHAHAELGQHEQAITHLHQALALAEQHHDPAQQAHTHHALAWAWEQRKDNQKALKHARHALDFFRALDSPLMEAIALNSVGWYAAHLGEYDMARDHCQDALLLHRRHEDADGEADALDSLGFIDHRTGHHERAVGHYRQAIALYRSVGNTTEAADTLDYLGHPLAALRRHAQARAAWQEALGLYRQMDRDTDAERVQRQLDDLQAAHELP